MKADLINNPADPEALRLLKRDFRRVAETLAYLANLAIGEQVTSFPIFVACREPIQLGLVAIPAEQHAGLTYTFRISTYEEMIRKGLLDAGQETQFRKAAGDPFHRACILLVDEGTANLVFIPYAATDPLTAE
jgi:hypothetical protein